MSERNNEGRLDAPEVQKEHRDLPDFSAETKKVSEMDFVTPTDHVELPSQGKFYDESHPFKDGVAEIYQMTAKHEDILGDKVLMRKGILFTRLISSLLVDKRVKAGELTTGDRSAILVAARRSAYGKDYRVKMQCPLCRSPHEITIDLKDDLTVRNPVVPEEYNAEFTEEGTLRIKLPSEYVIEAKVMTGKDELNMFKSNQARKLAKMGEVGVVDQMKELLVSLNDNREKRIVNKFIDNMPAKDSRYFRKTYKECIPDVRLVKDFHCMECNFVSKEEVAIKPEFFWPE